MTYSFYETKMDSLEREKFIRDDAQFRGWIMAKLESVEKEQKDSREELKSHLDEEMIELKEFNKRLVGLENWKTKITVMSSTISAIIGFAFSYFIK